MIQIITKDGGGNMEKTVLVVDDDSISLKMIRRYLEGQDYQVLYAMSGIQAIHILREQNVDLVLLDIEMPEMDGYATLAKLREIPGREDIAVIFFTGRGDRDTIKRCSTAGVVGYIPKPVTGDVLQAKIDGFFMTQQ